MCGLGTVLTPSPNLITNASFIHTHCTQLEAQKMTTGWDNDDVVRFEPNSLYKMLFRGGCVGG